MALNTKTFKIRTASAIVFAIVMLAGLLWNRWSFFILISIIHFGCWVEYHKLISKISTEYKSVSSFQKYLAMAAGWCLLLYFTNNELHIFDLKLKDLGFWLGLILFAILPLTMLAGAQKFFLLNLGYTVVGIIYISLSLALFIDLRNHWSGDASPLNLIIPLLIIFTIWVNDTMAYIVGSLIGKNPISSISPKKTWEGTIGGIILAVIVMCLLAFFTKKLSVLHTAVITTIAAIAGTFGDLFESKLKRLAGVKDSGNIMPGHGGFLDRFDSLLFATVSVWFYVVFFV